jgi:hypothetical protein
MVIIGPSESGKTVTIRNILYRNRERWRLGIAFTDSDNTEKDYHTVFHPYMVRKFVQELPASKVREMKEAAAERDQKLPKGSHLYGVNSLTKLHKSLNAAQYVSDKESFPRSVIILDDVGDKKNTLRLPCISDIFEKGRHHNTDVILVAQSHDDVPKKAFQNATIKVFCRGADSAYRDFMYQQMRGALPDFIMRKRNVKQEFSDLINTWWDKNPYKPIVWKADKPTRFYCFDPELGIPEFQILAADLVPEADRRYRIAEARRQKEAHEHINRLLGSARGGGGGRQHMDAEREKRGGGFVLVDSTFEERLPSTSTSRIPPEFQDDIDEEDEGEVEDDDDF